MKTIRFTLMLFVLFYSVAALAQAPNPKATRKTYIPRQPKGNIACTLHIKCDACLDKLLENQLPITINVYNAQLTKPANGVALGQREKITYFSIRNFKLAPSSTSNEKVITFTVEGLPIDKEMVIVASFNGKDVKLKCDVENSSYNWSLVGESTPVKIPVGKTLFENVAITATCSKSVIK